MSLTTVTPVIVFICSDENNLYCDISNVERHAVVSTGLAEGRFFQGIEIVALTTVRATI